MVLNAAVQMLREADELKETISKFKSGASMLQEHTLWTKQQQLQTIYQKVLILDLDYALDKKVEQDLWNVGFKQQIDALQAISKDRKSPLRSEGQAMLSWVLQAAAGFYLCLLHQICTTYQLDLPFRRRASLLGSVEGWSAGDGGQRGAAGAARYVCQHCLVHLGDLARYRHQLRVAHTFYRHALVVSVHSGHPYNQLALLAWRRARRLAAVYWHVRSVLVRAPFPPAPANLARTLRAASAQLDRSSLPVVPGVSPATGVRPACAGAPQRLDAHSYVTRLIRALHYIHTGDELDEAEELVKSLNSSLSTLIATDSFESMTLIKMAVVLMWSVHDATEELSLVDDSAAVTEGERRAANLALALAAGALLAALLPAYSGPPPARALPAVKVWLEWIVSHPVVVRSAAWAARPALWPALAHNLSLLAAQPSQETPDYESTPLPEEEELHGFVPLEEELRARRFPNHAAWGAQKQSQSPTEEVINLADEPGVEERIRAHRLVRLGKRLADIAPDHLTFTEEEGKTTFTAAAVGGEQLTLALAELASTRDLVPADQEQESDDEAPPPRPPTVISEAHFREKVRERRAGILKPQGSLERAREERALHTHDELEENSEDSSKCEDKTKERKPRVNIAMAAILRKQEDSNKQVKFVTPPPTPESTADSTESTEEKSKLIQPKALKSLGHLPIGRKTGGILSLKDKSGYPHLVNSPPEKEEKKERPSPPQNRDQASQRDQPTQNWPQQKFEPRMPYPTDFGPRPNAQGGSSYSSNINTYRPQLSPGIRLPVVNPKEIDVRSAALQKQNSRRDAFQDGQKHVSTDKRNFLNDLPPRFANQYRYWQAAHENRDDTPLNSNTNWRENYTAAAAPAPWWKPDESNANMNPNLTPNMNPNLTPNMNPNLTANLTPNMSNFNYNPVLKPNYFAVNNVNNNPNPYTNLPSYNHIQNSDMDSGRYQNLQRPIQSLQGLNNPDFASSLSGFGTFSAQIPYDAAMYPQFGYRPMIQQNYRDKGMDMNFGDDMKRRMFEAGTDVSANRPEQNKPVDGETGSSSNTYSLFSGAPPPAWGSPAHHPPHQSLWSGPGPSPLERLLEQQKMNQPPAPH